MATWRNTQTLPVFVKTAIKGVGAKTAVAHVTKGKSPWLHEIFSVSVWNYGAKSTMSFILNYMNATTGKAISKHTSKSVLMDGKCSTFRTAMYKLTI